MKIINSFIRIKNRLLFHFKQLEYNFSISEIKKMFYKRGLKIATSISDSNNIALK